jgi:hypothetical protein
VKGAGAIWDTADRFHFVYQPVTGDAEVVARVGSITEADVWSKAGVMIRESLTPESRHASMFASAGKGYAFQRRLTTGAYTDNTAGRRDTPPGWVKLVRAGDLFTAYRSTDGVTWTKVGADTVPMVATVYVGLAVASHDRDDATTTTAVVDSFKLTAAAAANGSPSVSITSPATGTQVTLPTTVAIAANASDPESRMASVDFYAGSTLIVRDTTAPYSANWTPSGAGTYALTAVAHDADGGSSTSGTVSLTVNTATNKAPTVSLTSPLAGTSFTAPATVTLSATASDPENQLARVEFYAGSARIGTDTTAPYSFSWTNVAAGTYSITARSFDAAGASATSGAASITVSAATTSTAAPKTVAFTASTDHATNVTNYVLKIFAATADTAKATAVATSDLGKPTPSSTGEITVDRATFFGALAAGTYQATVTAIGPSGQTPSTSITFTR